MNGHDNKYGFKLFYGLVIVCFMLLTVSAFGQNIKQAVAEAIKNNPRIKAQQSQVRAAGLETEAAFGESLPELNFDISYNHVTDIPEFKIPFIGSSVKIGTYDKFDSGISLKYVLFSGFARQNAITLKKQMRKIHTIGLEKLKKEVAFQTIAIYRKVQADKIEKAVLSASGKRIENQLKRTRSLVKEGMMLSLDTLNLSLALLENENKMLVVEANLQIDLQFLQNLTGTNTIPLETLPVFKDALVSQWQKQKNEQLKLLDIQKNMAETSAALHRSAFYPKAVVQAAYRYGKPGLDVISNKWMDYGIWGVGVSWNLFNGRADQLKK